MPKKYSTTSGTAISNMLIGSAGVSNMETTQITSIAIRHLERKVWTETIPTLWSSSITNGQTYQMAAWVRRNLFQFDDARIMIYTNSSKGGEQ